MTVLYTSAFGGDLAAGFKNLIDAWEGWLPSGLTVSYPTTGDILDSATGTLTGVWTGDPLTASAVGGPANHAQGVGTRIKWETGIVHDGRKVSGSTYMVPLCSNVYDTDGTLATGALSGMLAAAQTFQSGLDGEFGIWTRPKGGAGGVFSTVKAASVPDKVSWLRSRRT